MKMNKSNTKRRYTRPRRVRQQYRDNYATRRGASGKGGGEEDMEREPSRAGVISQLACKATARRHLTVSV